MQRMLDRLRQLIITRPVTAVMATLATFAASALTKFVIELLSQHHDALALAVQRLAHSFDAAALVVLSYTLLLIAGAQWFRDAARFFRQLPRTPSVFSRCFQNHRSA